MPRYAVRHDTTYKYSALVAQSHHELHLAPLPVPHQSVLRHDLQITPKPAWIENGIDYFGNPTSWLAIEKDHRELTIQSIADIVVVERAAPDMTGGVPWERVADRTAPDMSPGIREFACSSGHVRPSQAVKAYAEPSMKAGASVLAVAADLMARIHAEFKFDNTTTDVATPVEKVLEQRSGVCQDFAHLMISALRSFNLPVRYVSGYILTHPPPGREKLFGTDASHAWVTVWSPEAGWVDFDPTNKLVNSHELITIAIGRDFGDVSPISGVLLGGGAHSVSVSVDVRPAEPITPTARRP